MVEEILNQIATKKAELRALQNQLDQEACKEYSFLEGKYYRLAGTTCIKINHIRFVADNEVNVECVKITGGKYDGGRIRINMCDDYSFRLNEVCDLREISKDDFTKFMEEAFIESGVKVLEAIDNE